MDTVSPETRRRMMAAIRGTDTKPELLVRRALFARGMRYRVNCAGLPGKPDLKFTRYGAVVLVHGCFWHGHRCARFRLPSSNVAFWTEKIAKNRERDLRDVAALRSLGWRVCVVWECALRKAGFKVYGPALMDALSNWIRGAEPFLELYDPASILPTSRYPAESAEGGFGRNGDEGFFVAERGGEYRAK